LNQYGVSKFDGQTWTVYDQNNAQFPDNDAVNEMIFDDEHNELWIGLEAKWDGQSDHTGGGLARFDGNQWDFFNVSSQNFPSNSVRTLAFVNNLLWVGLENYYYWSQLETGIMCYYYAPLYSGLASFDENVIDIFDSTSSVLPTNKINDLAEDTGHNLWIATDMGLVKRFDGQFQIFDQDNSDLPDNNINCLYFDENDGLWIGTANGLALYNFTDWEVFTTENSGLKDNYITAIAIDEKNIKWIGTAGSGLALYGENGVALNFNNIMELRIPETCRLQQNYPNPFNPTTKINYELQITNHVTMNIYNLIGQKVATLVNERQQAGFHQVEWDASGFASGVYYYCLQAGEFVDVKKMVLLR
jgi:ligand-binding sensor domain-containing protein